MVVDRGGLRYPIEVVDLFSKNLQKFRAEIRAARQEATAFRRQSRAARQEGNKGDVVARRESAKAARDEAQAERTRLQQLQSGARAQKTVQDLKARMFRNERVEKERAEKATVRAARAQERASKQAAAAAKKAASAQNRLRVKTQQTDSAAQKLLFTFRRLVGVLALFTIARQVSQGFGALVKSGFEFNQTLERTRLGIAGIITAVGDVTDAQGKQLKGAEAFAAAQVSARRQQQLLRQDALRTVATFQELLDAFQIALGPGLAAGFNLDQVRQFSVLISQAAANIGLPQRQLSEEIRAILTGNIRQTTTRIAQVLNLTNKEIRKMKALGADVFFENLRERLQGFALGAEAAAQTVGGLFVRLKDVIELVAGTAAEGAFEQLRQTLQELFAALTDTEIGKFGKILTPDPKAQKAFEAIFNAINNVLGLAVTLGRTIGLDGLVNSATLFSDVLETVGKLIVILVTGAVRGFATLDALLTPIKETFIAIGEALPTGVAAELLTIFVQLTTVIFSLRIGFSILAGTVGKVIKLVTSLPMVLGRSLLVVNNLIEGAKIFATETKVGAGLWTVMKSRITLVLGAITVLVTGLKFVASSIFDINFALQDLPALFGTIFESVFSKIISFGEVVFATIKVRSIQAFKAVVAAAKTAVDEIVNVFDLELGTSAATRQLAIDERRVAAARRAHVLALENKALELEITEAKKVSLQIDKDANQIQVDKINKLKEQIALREKEALDLKVTINGEEPTVAGKKITLEFKALATILGGIITGFSQFVAQSISDAFDPTADTSIKERFARFLQQIAKLIIAQLVQLAIVKALLNTGVPGGLLPGVGKRKGGRIPGRAGPSVAHYTNPQGLEAGGQAVPPQGISRKDNVPIWAQKGEYMMRLSAVQKYGVGIMEALNQGLIDPGALTSMAGPRKMSRNTRRKVGFATGGQIERGAKEVASAQSNSGGGGAGLGAALLVANDTTAERLLAGGSKAVLDYIDEHGADIEGRLSRFRS